MTILDLEENVKNLQHQLQNVTVNEEIVVDPLDYDSMRFVQIWSISYGFEKISRLLEWTNRRTQKHKKLKKISVRFELMFIMNGSI